jgi:hypothetical protein
VIEVKIGREREREREREMPTNLNMEVMRKMGTKRDKKR